MDKKKFKSEPNKQDVFEIINLIKSKKFILAENKSKKLLKKYSNSPSLINLLGVCLINQNRIIEGIKCYKSAILIKPNFAEAYNNLGIAYKNLSMTEDAIKAYNNSIKFKSNFAEPYNNLGLILMDQNKIEEAKNNFRLALKYKPNLAFAHRHLSIITKYKKNNPHIKEMINAISNLKATDVEKMHIAFGLGKAFEDTNDFEKAFEYFNQANKLRRKYLSYNISDDIQFFKKIKSIFNEKLFKKFENSGIQDKTPIFIVGMFRSGTTLVEQILASHSKIFGGGESKVFLQVISKILNTDLRYDLPKTLINNEDLIFHNIGKTYLSVARKFQPSFSHITDKQPLNFKWIGLIKLALPNAKIIHCQRNPIDNCLSIYKNYFDFDDNPYAYDLEELANYYNLYKDLMNFWNLKLPNFIYNISYENLIKNQKIETTKLLNYCDLNWEESCMNFFKNKRNVNTASLMQVRRPIYKDSVNSWKKYEKNLLTLVQKLN